MNPLQMSQPQLVNFIMSRHHAALRDQIPRFLHEALAIEREGEAAGLSSRLLDILDELKHHLDTEEKALFPQILGGNVSSSVVQHLRGEHCEHKLMFKNLLKDFLPDKTASARLCDFYMRLRILRDELGEHAFLEDEILFPRTLKKEGTCCRACAMKLPCGTKFKDGAGR